MTLRLPSPNYISIYFLNLPLRQEERISPRNSSFIRICRHLEEEHIIYFQVSTKIYFPTIHNRFPAYSC